jgi:hypothetical protein
MPHEALHQTRYAVIRSVNDYLSKFEVKMENLAQAIHDKEHVEVLATLLHFDVVDTPLAEFGMICAHLHVIGARRPKMTALGAAIRLGLPALVQKLVAKPIKARLDAVVCDVGEPMTAVQVCEEGRRFDVRRQRAFECIEIILEREMSETLATRELVTDENRRAVFDRHQQSDLYTYNATSIRSNTQLLPEQAKQSIKQYSEKYVLDLHQVAEAILSKNMFHLKCTLLKFNAVNEPLEELAALGYRRYRSGTSGSVPHLEDPHGAVALSRPGMQYIRCLYDQAPRKTTLAVAIRLQQSSMMQMLFGAKVKVDIDAPVFGLESNVHPMSLLFAEWNADRYDSYDRYMEFFEKFVAKGRIPNHRWLLAEVLYSETWLGNSAFYVKEMMMRMFHVPPRDDGVPAGSIDLLDYYIRVCGGKKDTVVDELVSKYEYFRDSMYVAPPGLFEIYLSNLGERHRSDVQASWTLQTIPCRLALVMSRAGGQAPNCLMAWLPDDVLKVIVVSAGDFTDAYKCAACHRLPPTNGYRLRCNVCSANR